MKRLALLIIIPLAFACKTQKDATDQAPQTAEETTQSGSVEIVTNSEEEVEEANDSNTKPQKPYRVKATIGNLSRKSDHYTIREAYIEGNELVMDIQYSGGCARHTFEFVGSPAVAKSMPPQRAVKLIHYNGDDMCESMVDRTIRIDISDLAVTQAVGSQIELKIEGYQMNILYTYS